jgi:hypothetical protein
MKKPRSMAVQSLVVLAIGVAALAWPKKAHAGDLCNVFCADACTAEWTAGCYAQGGCKSVGVIICSGSGICADYGKNTIYCSG